MRRPPPIPTRANTLFPYTTLFRSGRAGNHDARRGRRVGLCHLVHSEERTPFVRSRKSPQPDGPGVACGLSGRMSPGLRLRRIPPPLFRSASPQPTPTSAGNIAGKRDFPPLSHVTRGAPSTLLGLPLTEH